MNTRISKVAWVSTVSTTLMLSLVIGCHPDPPQSTTPVVQEAVVQQPAVQYTPRQPTRPTTNLTYTEEWVHLPVQLVYASGSTRLSDENRALLREGYASVAHRTDIVRVRVEGHTDSRGDRATNEQIAQERAQGVIDFLVGELGMPRELFEVQSLGENAPRASGENAGDRLLNRRVEFSILVRRQPAM